MSTISKTNNAQHSKKKKRGSETNIKIKRGLSETTQSFQSRGNVQSRGGSRIQSSG